MRVFVTGATGCVGSAVALELKRRGHTIMALARSEASEEKLDRQGYEVVRGDLRDEMELAKYAALADAVVHAAFAGYPDGPKMDEVAVGAMLGALDGTGKPFLYTSGVWVYGPTGDQRVHEESTLHPIELVAWRPQVEDLVRNASRQGVNGVIIRPGVVYGGGRGMLESMAGEARERDAVRVVGSGKQRWAFVHGEDLGHLYAEALEDGAGGVFNATAPPSPTLLEVAQAIGLSVGGSGQVEFWPLQEARAELGPYADALALDQANISNEWAEESLGWVPRQPPVLAEIMAPSKEAGPS